MKRKEEKKLTPFSIVSLSKNFGKDNRKCTFLVSPSLSFFEVYDKKDKYVIFGWNIKIDNCNGIIMNWYDLNENERIIIIKELQNNSRLIVNPNFNVFLESITLLKYNLGPYCCFSCKSC